MQGIRAYSFWLAIDLRDSMSPTIGVYHPNFY